MTTRGRYEYTLRKTASMSGVTSLIIGVSRLSQLEDAVRAMSGENFKAALLKRVIWGPHFEILRCDRWPRTAPEISLACGREACADTLEALSQCWCQPFRNWQPRMRALFRMAVCQDYSAGTRQSYLRDPPRGGR